MNTKIEPGPLFKSVAELHESLVQHAKDALVEVDREHGEAVEEAGPLDSIGYQEPSTGKRVWITLAEYRKRRIDYHLRDRLAQIAGALWLDAESNDEEAIRYGMEFVLKALESRERSAPAGMLSAVLEGAAVGIRAAITRERVRELAAAWRARR